MSWTVTWRAVSATQEREFANELEARAFAGVLESLAPELAIECEVAEATPEDDALDFSLDLTLDVSAEDISAGDIPEATGSLFDAWFAGERAAAVGQDDDAEEHGSSSLVIVDLDAARAAKLDRLRGEGRTREEALIALLDAAE